MKIGLVHVRVANRMVFGQTHTGLVLYPFLNNDSGSGFGCYSKSSFLLQIWFDRRIRIQLQNRVKLEDLNLVSKSIRTSFIFYFLYFLLK